MESYISKARDFVKRQLDKDLFFTSFLSHDRLGKKIIRPVQEFFTTAIIASILKKENFIQPLLDKFFMIASKQWFTFYPEPIYPADADTNSVIFNLLLEKNYPITERTINLLDTIKQFSYNGICGVWLSNDRKQQFDPVVSCNIQILASTIGVQKDFIQNRDFVIKHLKTGNYLKGTRYYHSPFAFLYFLVKLAEKDLEAKSLIYNDLQKSIYLLKMSSWHPIDLAQSVIISRWAGLNIDENFNKLLNLQKTKGNIPADSLFQLGSAKIFFVSSALSTAFFIQTQT